MKIDCYFVLYESKEPNLFVLQFHSTLIRMLHDECIPADFNRRNSFSFEIEGEMYSAYKHTHIHTRTHFDAINSLLSIHFATLYSFLLVSFDSI